MQGRQVVKWVALVSLVALMLAVATSGTGAAPLAQETEEVAPYAIACGDSAFCASPNPAVYVQNNGTGPALHGRNIAAGAGAGVYGRAQGGAGVRGQSNSGNGVFGSSYNVAGVRGKSTWGAGVLAESVNNYGLKAESTNAEGVFGTNNSGASNIAGVRGDNSYDDAVWGDGGTYTFAYGGAFYGNRGIYGNADGVDISYAAVFEDSIQVLSGGCTGCTLAYMAVNSGDVSLETGDLVVITGMAPSLEGEGQIMAVQQAGSESTTAVVGVVDRRYVMPPEPLASANEAVTYDDPAIGTFVEGPIAPGQYLRIVVQGIAAVKVDASQGAIQPGDLLVSSSGAGLAMKGIDIQYGTLVGKALEPLAEGKGLIQVLVDLQ